MKPFRYAAPTTVAEAVSLLEAYGPRARPMAGGTDLLVQLRRGAFDLDLVVDVKKMPELNRITYDPVAGLTVGAAVPLALLVEHELAVRLYPSLIEAVRLIGGHATRARASLGGNLCNAAPSGDSIPMMIVLNAEAEIAGAAGRRRAPVGGCCTAPGETIIEPGELLVALHFPPPQPHTGAYYANFTPRGEMDISVAGAAVWVALSEDHERIVDARIALSAVAPTPLFCDAASEVLVGQAPSEAVFAEAAALAQEAARPINDMRGTAAQRRHLVGVLIKRALRGAVSRARGSDVKEAA